jgi:hypothetical protein
MRKLLAAVGVAGLIVALAAGAASAHECYNASRSAQGNAQIAANSNGHITFDEVLMFFLTDNTNGPGLCPAGAQVVIDEVEAAAAAGTLAVDTSVVIGANSTQAGGIDNSPNARAKANLSNGKGIDHLADNAALGAFLGEHIPDGFAACV